MDKLAMLEQRIGELEDRVERCERIGGSDLEHIPEIRSDLNFIKRSLEDIGKNDVAIRAHVVKVESDFYDDGNGLKYKIIDLLAEFRSYVTSLQALEGQLAFWGKWIVGLLGVACLSAVGFFATMAFRHFIR